MTIHKSALTKLALSTFLFAVPFNAAFAQDVTAIADRLKETAAKQGVEIGWSNITGDASSMVMENVTIKPVNENNALPIGNVTLSDVTEANGGYVIGTLSTTPFSKTEGGMTLDISAFEINGMKLPAEGDTDPLAAMMMYQSAELANVTVKVADKTAFQMDGLTFEITEPADGKPMAYSAAAEKITGDLSLVEDPQSKAVINDLGYQNINGFFEMNGSWQPSDGQWSLAQFDITVENAGTFGLTFDFGGLTADFIKAAQDIQKKMAEAPAGADNSAQGIAMLGLMQRLSFSGATIRFDDDSLTGKILEYVGKQQGMSAADVANQAKAMVPMGMMMLNNPELSNQVTTAVTAYLDNPQNLEIAAAPPAPVPFPVIMASAMGNQNDTIAMVNGLIKTLGISISANK